MCVLQAGNEKPNSQPSALLRHLVPASSKLTARALLCKDLCKYSWQLRIYTRSHKVNGSGGRTFLSKIIWKNQNIRKIHGSLESQNNTFTGKTYLLFQTDGRNFNNVKQISICLQVPKCVFANTILIYYMAQREDEGKFQAKQIISALKLKMELITT